MPTEVATKGADRCELHPASPTVAHCDTCGRALCLTCAVPVRGRVFGPECLPADVATELPASPATRPPMPRLWLLTGVAIAVLVVVSLLPWTRFGSASGWFGAWGWPLRWSMLPAVTGALALVIWGARRRRPGRGSTRLVATLGGAAAVGAVLAIANPPPFTRAAAAPWIAVAAGLAAAGSASLSTRRDLRSSV